MATTKKTTACPDCVAPRVCKLCVAAGVDVDKASFAGRTAYNAHLADAHGPRCAECGELTGEPEPESAVDA